MIKNRIFISYSRRDRRFLRRLLVHIKPLQEQGLIQLWHDKMILAGDEWKKQIQQAIKSAQVFILLVSADFLASDFIIKEELPPILAAAKDRGALILPVIVGWCMFQETESISRYQSVNRPSEPLDGLSKSEQEKIWYLAARRIFSMRATEAVIRIGHQDLW